LAAWRSAGMVQCSIQVLTVADRPQGKYERPSEVSAARYDGDWLQDRDISYWATSQGINAWG
jgi:hypothetical protein